MRAIIDKILAYVLIAIMSIMVCTVVWQVFSRYALNAPSSFTTELSGFLLIWIGLLGAAYATGQNMHMAIDLLPIYLKENSQNKLAKLIHIIIGIFALMVLVIGGGQLVSLSFQLNQISPTLQISIGYIYLVVPISGVLMLFYSIESLMQKESNDD